MLGEPDMRKPHQWVALLYSALADQVDYLMGDGDQFAQRNFSSEKGSDVNACVLIDLLERILSKINSLRSPQSRITYQVVSSTGALEWFKSQRREKCDPDCMVCVSLCYGKQSAVLFERAHSRTDNAAFNGPACEAEIILKDRERYKYLEHVDMGLRIGDASWHSPLNPRSGMDHTLVERRHHHPIKWNWNQSTGMTTALGADAMISGIAKATPPVSTVPAETAGKASELAPPRKLVMAALDGIREYRNHG